MKFKAIETEQALLFALYAANAALEDFITGSRIETAYSPHRAFIRYAAECFADELFIRKDPKNSPEKVDVSDGLCHDDA